MMEGPTIRIGGSTSFPDVSIASDVGSTLDITNINDFDLGLLGNQRKIIGTPPRAASPGGDLRDVTDGGNIEFINLEDTNVTFNIKPPVNNGAGDTIKILRDNSMMSPPKPFEPSLVLNSHQGMSAQPQPPMQPPPQSNTWFSSSAPSAPSAQAAPSGGIFQKFFGGGTSTSSISASAMPMDDNGYSQQAYLSPEQEAIKKSEGLTMLERMDRKGVGGTKMTVANSL